MTYLLIFCGQRVLSVEHFASLLGWLNSGDTVVDFMTEFLTNQTLLWYSFTEPELFGGFGRRLQVHYAYSILLLRMLSAESTPATHIAHFVVNKIISLDDGPKDKPVPRARFCVCQRGGICFFALLLLTGCGRWYQWAGTEIENHWRETTKRLKKAVANIFIAITSVA